MGGGYVLSPIADVAGAAWQVRRHVVLHSLSLDVRVNDGLPLRALKLSLVVSRRWPSHD